MTTQLNPRTACLKDFASLDNVRNFGMSRQSSISHGYVASDAERQRMLSLLEELFDKYAEKVSLEQASKDMTQDQK